MNAANNVRTKLAKAITASATSIEVQDASKMPPVPFLLTLARDEEIVKVTAKTGNILTVERSQEGTTAGAYVVDTDVWLNFTAGMLAELADKEYVDTKINEVPQPDLTGYETKTGAQSKVDALAGDGNTKTVKQLDDEVTTHWADLASQALNKGASLIGVHDADALFTATTVEGALKEAITKANSAFQSASNGKTVIKNAVTGVDPKVVIPPDPTFAQLATAIGNIKTGILMATGFVSIPANAKDYPVVTNCGFVPKAVTFTAGTTEGGGNSLGGYIASSGFGNLKKSYGPEVNFLYYSTTAGDPTSEYFLISNRAGYAVRLNWVVLG